MDATFTENPAIIGRPTDDEARPAPLSSRAARPTSRKGLWAGRVISGLAVLFLAFDASMKLLQVEAAVKGSAELGYSPDIVFSLGVLQAICLVVYLVPRTAVLGAVLWTGYLGGAIATHVRIGNPLFTHELFPIYVALLLWGGLWLRDARLRSLFPVRRAESN
jgi:hypothetical protein